MSWASANLPQVRGTRTALSRARLAVIRWRGLPVLEEADRSVAISGMPLRIEANKTTARPSPLVGRLHREHASYTPDQSTPGRVMEQARSHKGKLRQLLSVAPPYQDRAQVCLPQLLLGQRAQ